MASRVDVVFFFSLFYWCGWAVNLAAYKQYSLSEPGMSALRFSSAGEGDYVYTPVYLSYSDMVLTSCEDEPLRTLPHGLLWHHADTPFNVSVTLDLETAVAVSRLRLFGACCNMGIYTPTAVYLLGSASVDGPFDLLASKTSLTSGDQLETPAVTYILDLDVSPGASAYRYYRVSVTGEPDRYVSIISVQLFD